MDRSTRARRLAQIGITSIMCLLLPAVQLTWAGGVGTVSCCCGEHSADSDCGCPDCPAEGDSEDACPCAKVQACGGSAVVLSSSAPPLVILETEEGAIDVDAEPVDEGVERVPLSAVGEPETPPPRRS